MSQGTEKRRVPLVHLNVYEQDFLVVTTIATANRISAGEMVRRLIEAASPTLPERDRKLIAALSA